MGTLKSFFVVIQNLVSKDIFSKCLNVFKFGIASNGLNVTSTKRTGPGTGNGALFSG